MRRLEVGSSKLPWGRSSLKETGVSAEWDEYVHDLHQLRLKHVRADVKEYMKTPRSLSIRRMKERRRGATATSADAGRARGRRRGIPRGERANRATDRLSDVMRKPGDVSEMVHASMVRNENTHKTLNKGYRKKEMKRIGENKKLITRIESGESTYSRKAWASDRRKILKTYLVSQRTPVDGHEDSAEIEKTRAAQEEELTGRHITKATHEFTGFKTGDVKSIGEKEEWAKSLPPLEAGAGSPVMGQSESMPSISFGRPELQIGLGSTLMKETTLGSGIVKSTSKTLANRNSTGGLSLSGSIGGHNSSKSPINSPSPKKNAKSPKSAVPNHTKVFEAGRQMNHGKFAVLSAIHRPIPIIQAFVPEDQTTTEVEVTPKEAKFALRHLSNDIFRPERREDFAGRSLPKFSFSKIMSHAALQQSQLAGNPKSPVAPTKLGMPIKGIEQIITIKAKYQGYQGKNHGQKRSRPKKTEDTKRAKKAPAAKKAF